MHKALFIVIMIDIFGGTRDSIQQSVVQADPRQLYLHVKHITNTAKPRNYINIEALHQAAEYIRKQFDSLAYQTTEQTYMVAGSSYKNIIARLDKSRGEKVIIGAHYDVFGDQPGADDNASGIAGLLEIARVIKQVGNHIPYDIELVAYTLEEPPFFGTEYMGSYVHARTLHENSATIAGMICLEMIGYYSDKKNSQTYPFGFMGFFYPRKGDFIAAIANFSSRRLAENYKHVLHRTTSLKCLSFAGPSWIPGVDFSDHRNYWLYGYKGMMLTDTSFLRNKNYHQPSDTIATLNFQKMAAVVQGVINLLINKGI